MKLEEELARIKVDLSAAEDQVDREIAKVHRSYRSDIILRKHLHPDVRRRLKDLFE